MRWAWTAEWDSIPSSGCGISGADSTDPSIDSLADSAVENARTLIGDASDCVATRREPIVDVSRDCFATPALLRSRLR